MKNEDNLISIIIPCYNASDYISETLSSIIKQSNVIYEIIIINDGSTDDSETKIQTFNDDRIRYFYQNNKGVSVARNNGLRKAKGKYVIFFDADDIMTPDFISSRISLLENDSTLDFVSGEVQKFNEFGFLEGTYRGTSEDLVQEILFYNKEVVTCPSNYCFRFIFLLKNQISFNSVLASTADRFFLLECSKFGSGIFSSKLSKLNYRVVQSSMSHLLTKNLVLDNEEYYRQIIKSQLIPVNARKETLFLGYFILFASFWKVNCKFKAFKYAFMCIFINPFKFLKKGKKRFIEP